jgi:hypothetical protein
MGAMHDPTKARNYSPAGARFRCEHKRHRDWGLQQRHADKLRYLNGEAPPAEPLPDQARPTIPPPPRPGNLVRPGWLRQPGDVPTTSTGAISRIKIRMVTSSLAVADKLTTGHAKGGQAAEP